MIGTNPKKINHDMRKRKKEFDGSMSLS